jgi:hypothetical protein
MAPGNLSEIDLEIDEAFIASLEEVLDVSSPFNELLESGEGIVDLMLIQMDEVNGFLFLADVLLGGLHHILLKRQPFLQRLSLDLFLLHFRLNLDRLFRLCFLLLFSHCC